MAVLIAPATHASVRTAGGVKYVTKKVPVEAVSGVTATASCPKATRVIGGGERNGAGVGQIRLAQTFPYDDRDKGLKPDDGWRVRVVNVSSSKRNVKVGAVCGDARVKYVEQEFNVAATSQTGQENATCPNDMFALSGGVEAGKNHPLYLNSSFPSDPSANGATAWGTYVDNTGGASSATVHVMCSKRKPRISRTTVSDIPPAAQGSVAPTCPARRIPFGGGQDNGAGYLGIRTNSLGPLGTAAWLAAVDNFGASPVDMGAYVVCGRPLN